MFKYLLFFLLAQSGQKEHLNDLPTLYSITESRPDLSKLAELMQKTEIKFKLNQSREATIFMPTNSAFEQFKSRFIDVDLLTYPELISLLNYHILPETVKLFELAPGPYTFISIETSHIYIDIAKNYEITINANTRIENNQMYNTPMGVAYVIDSVLLPNTLVDIVEQRNNTKVNSSILDIPEHVQLNNVQDAVNNDKSNLVLRTIQQINNYILNDESTETIGVITEANHISQTFPEQTIEKPDTLGRQQKRKTREDYKASRTRSGNIPNTYRIAQLKLR